MTRKDFFNLINEIIDDIRKECPLEEQRISLGQIFEAGIPKEIGDIGELYVKGILEDKNLAVYYPPDFQKRCLIDIFSFDGDDIYFISVKSSQSDNFPNIPDADEARYNCAARLIFEALQENNDFDGKIKYYRYNVQVNRKKRPVNYSCCQFYLK
jgi:hypothetical protein